MIDDIASDVRAQAVPPVDGRRARAGFWLVAAVYTLVMLGGTLPIPLYALWAPPMGFGPFTTTPVFAVYALGTVLPLTAFASLSDRVGRRPLLAAAVFAAATSTALFLLADDVGTLLAARFLCGIGTGVYVPGRHRRPGDGHGEAVDHRAPGGSAIPHSGCRGVRGRAVGTVTADVRCRNASGWYGRQPGFRRGVGGAQRLADPRRRADLLSTDFLFAYTGTIVLTLALGPLDQTINQDVPTLILAVAVVATTLASALSRPTTAIA
ncbi:MFS transporter [Streptomyces mirabilis]|uniref:MFS transporter n=1 Tax=Streptomyces mirabilis TaxID=68239 RepID=UPI003248E8FA